VGATTIVAIHGSRANRGGSRFQRTECVQAANACRRGTRDAKGVRMPRGRSTFTKRQKEQTRQQRQRDKAERRNQRKQEKAVAGSADELAELREHAAEQAALFNLGAEDADAAEQSASGDSVGE
jgi:hypothetical protein